MDVERSSEIKRDVVVVLYDYLDVVSDLLMDSISLKERSFKPAVINFIANIVIYDSIVDEHKVTCLRDISLEVDFVDY